MHRLLILLLLTDFSAITALADSVVVNCDAGQSLNTAISKLNKQIPDTVLLQGARWPNPQPATLKIATHPFWVYKRLYKPGQASRAATDEGTLTDAYPTIRVVALHGPYESCSATPPSVDGGSDDLLSGAFFIGMMESSTRDSLLVDGGETYTYRTGADYSNSYQWRKHGMAAPATSCLFLTSSDKALLTSRVNFSFGIYDKPYPPPPNKTVPMDSTIARTTMAETPSDLENLDARRRLSPSKLSFW
jgi:hypothetical protein